MRRERVTIRKWNGDDLYSWAVFLDGHLIEGLTGLNRSQAQYYRDVERKRIADRSKSAKK